MSTAQLHEKYEDMKDKKDVLDHLRESLDGAW